MRTIFLAGAAMLLVTGGALAQSRLPSGCYHNGIPDCGPTTPGADSAFAGGGLVIVNPNGGPPPRLTEPLPPLPQNPYYLPR